MNLRLISSLVLILPLFALSSSPAWSAPDPEGKNGFSWREEMRALEKSLSAILVHASGDEGKTPNKTVIENVEKIAKIAGELEENYKKAPGQDPSFKLFSKLFASDARLALKSLKSNSNSYGMQLATGLNQYCIACHTRSPQGGGIKTAWMDPKLAKLKPIETLQYYASTRQFDSALENATNLLKNDAVPNAPIMQQERAARLGLAIAVRVKNSPEESAKIIQSIEESKTMPLFLRNQAAQWKKQVGSWKSEGTKKKASPREAAKKLLAQARRDQLFPVDRSQDVLYLRASALLHEALEKNPQDAEATFLLGTTYEVLRPLQLWEVQEFYYLSCIHLKPQSKLAQTCYDRYEESVYLGYTGSAGTDLPDEISDRLISLKDLAYPKAKPRTPIQ